MDHERIDALSRALAYPRPRRTVLGLVLGVTLLNHGSLVSAKPGKAKGKGHSKSRGTGHAKGKGQGHVSDKECASLACDEIPVPSGEKAEFCCKGGFCSCGGSCCQGHCFQANGTDGKLASVICCTGKKLVECPGNTESKEDDTCCAGSCNACEVPGPLLIAGSYRRR